MAFVAGNDQPQLLLHMLGVLAQPWETLQLPTTGPADCALQDRPGVRRASARLTRHTSQLARTALTKATPKECDVFLIASSITKSALQARATGAGRVSGHLCAGGWGGLTCFTKRC